MHVHPTQFVTWSLAFSCCIGRHAGGYSGVRLGHALACDNFGDAVQCIATCMSQKFRSSFSLGVVSTPRNIQELLAGPRNSLY